MERWVAKVIAIFASFLIILICTALPIKVHEVFAKRGRRGLEVIAVFTCFGGGAFLGAFLLHMVPEVRHTLEDALLEPQHIHYPLPELFISFGFFFVMFLEKLIYHCLESNAHKNGPSATERSLSTPGKHPASGSGNSVSAIALHPFEKNNNPQMLSNGSSVQQHDESKISTISRVDEIEAQKEFHKEEDHDQASSGHHHHDTDVALDNVHHHHHHHHYHVSVDSIYKGIILMVALSMDCIFEGLTLGLQSTQSGVWNMLLVLISHEWIMGLTLGLELIKHNSPKRVLLYAVVYALTVPIGIAIGTIITETSEANNQTIDIVSATLKALSAGVFLYCTFFEILGDHVAHNPKLATLLGTFFGFCFIGLIALIPHDHDDDHDHDHNHTHPHIYDSAGRFVQHFITQD